MTRSSMCGALAGALFAIAVTPTLSFAQSTSWTVDDDPGADFSTIAEAIASPLVASGDRLRVQPGTYGPFALAGKNLSILGPGSGPRPQVTGTCSVVGVTSFTLAGLALEQLSVSDVPGRGQVDDCDISRPQGDFNASALSISSCGEILLSRVVVENESTSSCYFLPDTPALAVHASLVRFTGGRIKAGGSTASQCDGQDSLRITDSDVMLAGVDVYGGAGGPVGLFVCCSGYGGDALVTEDSVLVFRGAAADLRGGFSSGTSTPDGSEIVSESSTVVYSGVSGSVDVDDVDGTSVLLQPAEPEPFLEVLGSDIIGQSRRLLLHGPSGAGALVATSLAPNVLSLPGLEGLIWFDLGAILSIQGLVTQGQGNPTTSLFPPLPPGIDGVTVQVQAAFLGLPGTLDPTASLLTNPSNLIVRF